MEDKKFLVEKYSKKLQIHEDRHRAVQRKIEQFKDDPKKLKALELKVFNILKSIDKCKRIISENQ